MCQQMWRSTFSCPIARLDETQLKEAHAEHFDVGGVDVREEDEPDVVRHIAGVRKRLGPDERPDRGLVNHRRLLLARCEELAHELHHRFDAHPIGQYWTATRCTWGAASLPSLGPGLLLRQLLDELVVEDDRLLAAVLPKRIARELLT